MACDVCQGSKSITVATFCDQGSPPVGTRIYPCPECSMVPFKRVRATKISTSYPAETFARGQAPIERTMAARFGEYLYREGLVRFSTKGSSDFGLTERKIVVTAHLNVVEPKDARKAGADPEIALIAAPKLPDSIRERIGAPPNAKRWKPPALSVQFVDELVTDEFDEPKDAVGRRFSGLEFG